MTTSTATNIGVRRGVRTIVQTLGGGGFTLLVEVFAGTLDPFWRLVVMGVSTAAVALAQNYLEAAGKIPVLLPMPGLVVAPAADVAVATVEAVADKAGGIVGDVTDTAGEVIGAVTGQTTDEHNEAGQIAIAVVVFVLVLFAMFVACDAVFDDEDEVNDLGGQGVELVAGGRGGDCRGDGSCESHPGSDDCRDAKGECSDDDFKVDSIVVCVQPESCRFD